MSATVFVALIAGICAYGVHQGCFHPGPPVSRPGAGTPRGEYCSFVNPKAPWISLTLGPTILMALVGVGLRKHLRLLAAAALLIGLLLIANAAVANSLDFSTTI